jgi:phosphatidylinositol 4-kinase
MDKTILDQTREDAILLFQRSRRLLQLLSENEISHLHTLNNPCPDHGQLFKMEYTGYLEMTMTEDS